MAYSSNAADSLTLEFLKKWRGKRGRKATCRSLIKLLWRSNEIVLALKACDILCAWQGEFDNSLAPSERVSTSTMPTFSDLRQVRPAYASDDSEFLDDYAQYVRSIYAVTNPDYFINQWPPPPVSKEVGLTLKRVKCCPVHVREGAGKRDIDGLLLEEELLRVEDLFRLDDNATRQIVLIEGAPGSGKSTLGWNVCKKWKSYEMFLKFKVVVYIHCREQYVQKAASLITFLPGSYSKPLREQAAAMMEAYRGQDILFIVDGWDEYDPQALNESFLHKLMFTPEKVNLQFSTVLVTARRISSGALLDLATSRVQVLGFTPAEVRKYFQKALHEDYNPQAVQTLYADLRVRPQLEASCYLPMCAAFVSHICLGRRSLPPTHYAIYSDLACSYVIRDLTKRERDIPAISSIKRLPPVAQEPFAKLCALAYESTTQKKVLLSTEDLRAFGVSTTSSDLSLIQQNETASYSFLDPSVQEMLVAIHVSRMSMQKQVQHFRDLFNQVNYGGIIQCYNGLSQLDPPAVKDVILDRLQEPSQHIRVIRCVYDSQNELLAKTVASKLNNRFSGHFTNFTALEYRSVSYFLRVFCESNQGEFTVDIKQCFIDNYSVGFLTKELAKKGHVSVYEVDPNTLPPLPGWLVLDLSHNLIHGSGLQRISAAVNGKFCAIRSLDMSYNAIQEGEDGLQYLLQGLKTNRYVVELTLVSCSLQITEGNGPALVAMLKENTALQKLNLSQNEIGDIGVTFIAEGLQGNTALLELSLCHCGIRSEGAKSLSKVLTEKRILPFNPSHSRPGNKRHRDALQDLHMHMYRFKLATQGRGHSSHDPRLLLELYDSYDGATSEAHLMKMMMRHNPRALGSRHAADYGFLDEAELLASIAGDYGSLQLLNLSENELTDSGATHLAEAVKVNDKLHELHVGSCAITDQGVAVLATALKENSTLELLALDHNPISDVGLTALGSILSKNKELTLSLCSLKLCTSTALKQLQKSAKSHKHIISDTQSK